MYFSIKTDGQNHVRQKYGKPNIQLILKLRFKSFKLIIFDAQTFVSHLQSHKHRFQNLKSRSGGRRGERERERERDREREKGILTKFYTLEIMPTP